MLAIVSLHHRVRPDRLPGGLDEIAPYQSMCSHAHPRVANGIATLVYARGKAHISGQLLDVVEPAEVPQLAQDTTGHDGPNSRYAAQEHVIFLKVLLGMTSEQGGHFPELPVDETKAPHTPAQDLFSRFVLKLQTIEPVPETMAPMVVVVHFRNLYAIIQQLHLDVALGLAHVLDQIVTATEQAA